MLIVTLKGWESMESLELMKQLLKAGDRFRRMDLSVLHPGISQGEFVVLERIHACSGQYGDLYGAQVSELVRELEISPPALSRTLRFLEGKRLVMREADRRDRRNTCVCLTPYGEQIRKEGHDRLKEFARSSLEQMGQEEMKELIGLWNRLADVVQDQLRTYRKGD